MPILLIAVLSILASLTFPSHANAADPDGVYQYCQEKLNKNDAFNCDCVVEKYYPKKAELAKLYGVPMEQIEPVLIHVTSGCTNVAKTTSNEYNTCMSSPTFKTSKNEFGAERFCRCYSEEWEKALEEYIAIPNNVIDRNSRKHLKGSARSICKRRFR